MYARKLSLFLLYEKNTLQTASFLMNTAKKFLRIKDLLDFIDFIYLPMSEEFEEMFDGGDKRFVFSTSFLLKKILGKGAFGTVVSAIQRSDQKEVAVKVLFLQCPPCKKYSHRYSIKLIRTKHNTTLS